MGRRKGFMFRPLEDTFWEKVDVRGPDDCWLWKAAREKSGYGSVKVSGKVEKAHRVAFKLSNGDLPDDIDALHTCDNPPCCNPRHLVSGTHQDNMRDRNSKGRQWSKLKEEDWREIRRLGKSRTITHERIALQFKVSRSLVTRIVNQVDMEHCNA